MRADMQRLVASACPSVTRSDRACSARVCVCVVYGCVCLFVYRGAVVARPVRSTKVGYTAMLDGAQVLATNAPLPASQPPPTQHPHPHPHHKRASPHGPPQHAPPQPPSRSQAPAPHLPIADGAWVLAIRPIHPFHFLSPRSPLPQTCPSQLHTTPTPITACLSWPSPAPHTSP